MLDSLCIMAQRKQRKTLNIAGKSYGYRKDCQKHSGIIFHVFTFITYLCFYRTDVPLDPHTIIRHGGIHFHSLLEIVCTTCEVSGERRILYFLKHCFCRTNTVNFHAFLLRKSFEFQNELFMMFAAYRLLLESTSTCFSTFHFYAIIILISAR